MHDGFDPGIEADPLYVRDPKSGAYRLLDYAVHAQLIDGSLRP
jgi:fatty-acyl-CoA synthase